MIKANLSQNGEVQDWRENDFKTVKHLTLQNMKNNRFPFEIKTIENDSFIIFQQFEYLKFKNININSLSPKAFCPLVNLKILYLSKNNLDNIGKNDFYGLRSLEELYLNNNQIKKIEANSFNHLINLKKLNISSNKLSFFDSNIFNKNSDLEEINISSNKINNNSVIPLRFLPRLKNLYLNFNFLENIDRKNCFLKLKWLEKLDLTGNNISFLAISSFSIFNFKNLKILILSKNSITLVNPCFLSGLDQLEVLRLDFNSLKRIESDTFIHLKNLKFLDLSSNKITFIGLNGFRGLKKLKTLILNNNKIKTYSFDCIKNLKKLCMNDCSLTDDFNWRKLKYIENLTILELRHNFFTTLTAKFSQNILKLRRFILYDNEINHIDNEGLKYLTFLKTLDLSCNRLTQIDGNFFKGLKSLVTLNLSFNKISEVKNSFKDLNILDLSTYSIQ